MFFFAYHVMDKLMALHEGHGHGAPGEGKTLWHYVTEAEHWPLTAGTATAVILLAALGVLAIRWAIQNRKASTRIVA
ncbi:MAG: hypothetical protein Q8M16_24350 [Pirellulaceae bacterium]|nr:hypothetical protein [Pirellulaceae bacterium]